MSTETHLRKLKTASCLVLDSYNDSDGSLGLRDFSSVQEREPDSHIQGLHRENPEDLILADRVSVA
jgi:hypothetical protein